jgi:hypothetical protein
MAGARVMAVAEILVSSGVVAVVAAIAGGGLAGAGWQVPVLNSLRRQALLAAAGIAFILCGLYLSEGNNPFARRPQMRASIGGGIDFRSSEPSDGFRPGANRGYLVLTSPVKVRNRGESSSAVTWEDTDATLLIGGSEVPFRAYYFLSGGLDWQHWLGEKRDTAGPVMVRPGETQQRDILFMPRNAGQGAYLWDDLLRHVLGRGHDPLFRVAVHVDGGGVGSGPVPATCSARVGQFVEASRERARSAEHFQPSLTVPCQSDGERGYEQD